MRWVACLVAAMVAAGAVAQELTEKPDVLKGRFEWAKLTLAGIKIGVPVAGIPPASILEKGEHRIDLRARDMAVYHRDGRVETLHMSGRWLANALGLRRPEDVEATFGKAEEVRTDKLRGDSRLATYVYHTRGLTVSAVTAGDNTMFMVMVSRPSE